MSIPASSQPSSGSPLPVLQGRGCELVSIFFLHRNCCNFKKFRSFPGIVTVVGEFRSFPRIVTVFEKFCSFPEIVTVFEEFRSFPRTAASFEKSRSASDVNPLLRRCSAQGEERLRERRAELAQAQEVVLRAKEDHTQAVAQLNGDREELTALQLAFVRVCPVGGGVGGGATCLFQEDVMYFGENVSHFCCCFLFTPMRHFFLGKKS